MATVATGIPPGICTMLRSESMPSSGAPFGMTGTPTTGRGVMEATIPGKCAAPPAPAMIALMPLLWAFLAKSNILSGVRCADTIVTSVGTPKSASTSAACFMTYKSESDPMITATWVGPLPSAPSGSSAAIRPRTLSFLATASAREDPVTVMCPIFLPGLTPSLPYQCGYAPGTGSALLISASAISAPSSPLASPRMLIIEHPPHVSEVSPSGHPSTALTCCSYWLVTQASMV
mmetsp:Transcript_9674/g.33367  ORF Transcript_9674/g.33367 Transcript_9674/m.33367 type:complete len:233 (-) Transcript_9674:1199-1897(-)